MKYVGAVIGLLILVLFLCERAFPYWTAPTEQGRDARHRLFRMAKNLAIGGINFASAPVVAAAATQLAGRHALAWRPVWLGGWAGFAFDMVLLDLWIYAWHRAVHAWSFTWRFHQVHHQDEALDVTTAVRFHPGDVFLSSISRASVILLFGIPLRHVFLFEATTVVISAFHDVPGVGGLRSAYSPAGIRRQMSKFPLWFEAK